MKNLTVEEFIRELGSSSPAPGGGSVAALSIALSGALTSMVYSLTIGKKIYNTLSDDIKDNMEKNFKESNLFLEENLDFIEKDKEVFLKLMDCYKLPKITEEEKGIRLKAIEDKTYDAMMVPLELLRKSLGFYKNIKFSAKYGNSNAVSDAGVSAIMLHGGIESAILNVKINLLSLKNKELKDKIIMEIEECLKKSIQEKEDIIRLVNKKIQ